MRLAARSLLEDDSGLPGPTGLLAYLVVLSVVTWMPLPWLHLAGVGAPVASRKALESIPDVAERRRLEAVVRRRAMGLAYLCMAPVLPIGLCAFFGFAQEGVGVWWHWLMARLGGQ